MVTASTPNSRASTRRMTALLRLSRSRPAAVITRRVASSGKPGGRSGSVSVYLDVTRKGQTRSFALVTIAERTGLSQAAISRIANGGRGSRMGAVESIAAMADVLCVEPLALDRALQALRRRDTSAAA